MNTPAIDTAFDSVQVLLGAVVLYVLARSRESKTYWPLLALSLWQVPASFALKYMRHNGEIAHNPLAAYHIYFSTYWGAFTVSTVCALLLPYILFRSALRPLPGLRDLGNIVFTWIAVISAVTALSVTFSQQDLNIGSLIEIISQMQRLSALLIVSLVAFVATAIRPLGLSIKSRVFGVSLGMLVVATTNLLQATSITRTKDLFSAYSIIQMASSCIAQAIWIYYFATPEPQRKFVLLPTTSPFHYWNEISRRLDQDPGVVAIGGVDPSVFAGAEVEVFRRASAKMKSIQDTSE